MPRRRRPKPAGKNIKVEQKKQKEIKSMLKKQKEKNKDYLSTVLKKTIQGSEKKEGRNAAAHLGVKPKSNAPRIKKYPKLTLFKPVRLPSGNYVVSLKANLKAVTPEKLTGKKIHFPWGIVKKSVKPKRKSVELWEQKNITLQVEYNPNKMPSRKGKGKIHIQIAGGSSKVGLTKKDKWRFIELLKRIHKGEKPKQTETFKVTLAKAYTEVI